MLHFSRLKNGNLHLETRILLPRPLTEVFAFFSNAANLERLTPPFLKFEILTPPPITMRVGLEIDYCIRLYGVPMKWKTLITAWEPGRRFVDEQLKGPYQIWRHEHLFEEENGSTWCTDRVEYNPLGGIVADRLFVRANLNRIFAYRHAQMQMVFSSPSVK